MSGSAARRALAEWQQVDPKPATTSTAPRTVAFGPPTALAPAALAAPRALPAPADPAAPPTLPAPAAPPALPAAPVPVVWPLPLLDAARPSFPLVPATAPVTTALVPEAKRTVPVKASRAVPTTRASTITAASGATGTQLVRCRSARRICHSVTCQCHECGGISAARLAAAAVRPYQARASTIPPSPATATMPAVSRRAISAEASDRTPKEAITHAAVRTGGNRPHQAWPTPPWLSAT